MHKHHDVVRAEAPFAQVRDHPGGSLTRVDRVEDHALLAGKQPDRLRSGLRGTAIARPDEVAEVHHVVFQDLKIETKGAGRLIGDRRSSRGDVKLTRRRDTVDREIKPGELLREDQPGLPFAAR